jgi:hypothetical protein
MESTGSQLTQPTEEVFVVAVEKTGPQPPPDTFLLAALGSMGVSLGLQLFGRRLSSRFIGQWVPILLLFGLYNRMTKLAERDRTRSQPLVS